MNLTKFIQKYSIPNVISISRLLIAIYLYFQVEYTSINPISLIVIVSLIGLSDALDGFLARKYNAVTNFGTIIDPFVDRTVFIILIIWLRPILSDIFFWGIVIRDICVLLGSIFILKREKTIKVSNIGKYTTVFLFVTICFYILSININLGILLNIFAYSSLLMYYFVALEYLYKQVLFSE